MIPHYFVMRVWLWERRYGLCALVDYLNTTCMGGRNEPIS